MQSYNLLLLFLKTLLMQKTDFHHSAGGEGEKSSYLIKEKRCFIYARNRESRRGLQFLFVASKPW